MSYLFLKKEFTCLMCMAIYKDPVMLHCGHSFCRDCIKAYIRNHGQSGLYCCPECKKASKSKAPLTINSKLKNIAHQWKTVENHFRLGEALCTSCLETQSTAVKICLCCESSLCKKHIAVHSKSHPLADVKSTLQNMICSTHGEILRYYCKSDQTLICISCLSGDHRDHETDKLQIASRQRRQKLQGSVKHLHAEVNALKTEADALKQVMSKNKARSEAVKGMLKVMCSQLLSYVGEAVSNMEADLEKQDMDLSQDVSDEISCLEKKEKQLSQEIKQIEYVCNQEDPMLVFQDKTCSKHYNKRRKIVHRAKPSFPVEYDKLLLSLKFENRFQSFAGSVFPFLASHCIHLKYKIHVLLDGATASNYLKVSPDRRAVCYASVTWPRNPPHLGQFKTSQVLSELAFSSGKRYWEVKVGKNGVKSVGVAYPSIQRSGQDSFIGYNKKSWSLTWSEGYIEACHNSECTLIDSDKALSFVGVYVDYDLGTISFYRISSVVEHLFTFSGKFTEPLHAAFYVVNSWIKINPKWPPLKTCT